MCASNHVGAIAWLSESEGVFTTAQAKRMGIPRDALHDAVESGRLERIVRGAYRMVGSASSFTDELAAIWKLTAPAKFSHERMRVPEWDGIAIGGPLPPPSSRSETCACRRTGYMPPGG